MAFPIGMLEIVSRKSGQFGEYRVQGAWVRDDRGNRGWYIDLDGIESGAFAVCDGEIHPSGRHYFAGPNSSTFAPISAEIADIPNTAKNAILAAIAQWEKDEREKACT